MTYLLKFLVSCGECGSPKVERHCDFCNTSLCVSCVGKHFSDSTKTHNAVPYISHKHDKLGYTFVRCPSRIFSRFCNKKCERFCKKCNVPVCSMCISGSGHTHHEVFLLRRVPPELNKRDVNASYTNVLTNEHELLDKAQIIATIDTGFYRLFGVASFKNQGIWTCGNDENVALFDLKGKKLQNIKTTSMRRPRDIAVTTSGDLVYTDPNARTVNRVKSDQIQELFVLEGWKPYHICCTTSDDFLLTMIRNDEKQSKVVRYTGNEGTEKQTYQFDDKGKPLYSSDHRGKYICENNNLDVCVSDAGSIKPESSDFDTPAFSTTRFSPMELPLTAGVGSCRWITVVDLSTSWIWMAGSCVILLTAICMNHTVCAQIPLMHCLWLSKMAM